MRLLLMLLASLPFAVLAQPATLAGSVTDSATGEPLPGATVSISKSIGTVTDNSGKYSLRLPPGTYTVTYSYTGYQKQTLTVILMGQDVVIRDVQLQLSGQVLEQVVVSSSRYEQSLGEVTVSMEVLKPATIEQFSQTSLSESLEYASGVNIIDGQPNIRGGSGYSYGAGSRVMLLQDGLPMLTGDAGFPIWAFVPIEQTGQIEIIKGASSVMYGSAALNGVVNFRTAWPTAKPKTQITAFQGIWDKPGDNITNEVDRIMPNIVNGDTVGMDTTFKERKWWDGASPFFTGIQFSHRQQLGNSDLILGGQGYAEDSYLKDDFVRRGRINAKFRYRFPNIEGLSMGMGVNAMKSRSATFFLWQNDQSGAFLPLANTVTENNATRLTLDPFIDWLPSSRTKHSLQMRYYHSNNDTDREQGILSNLAYVNYLYQHRFTDMNLILSGGITGMSTYTEAELYGDTTHTAFNQGAYLQLEKKFWDRLTLLAGGRIERNRINDDPADLRPVFRAGANLRIGEGTFVRASFGQGYRYPTIAERYIRTDVGAINVFPNPDLAPEYGYSTELGLRQGLAWKDGGAYLDVAAFYTAYQDMMEFSFGGASGTLFGFQSVNVGDTYIPGLEAMAGVQHKLGKWELGFQGGYTYIDPKYVDFDSVKNLFSSADYNVLKYRFRHTFNGQLQLGWKTLSLGASARYYSNMEAIDQVFVLLIPGVAPYRDTHTGGTWVSDLALNWELSDHLTLGFIVKNWTNTTYALRPALMEEPRGFVVRIQASPLYNFSSPSKPIVKD